MKRRRIYRWVALVFTVLMLMFIGAAWFVGSSLVAPAQRAVGPPPDDLPVETVTLSSESGATLAAWYIPAENATATVVLLHPIRGDRRSMLDRARLFYDAGYSTFLVDLQAHGESSGDHITAGYRERHDVVAAVDYVRSRNPDHQIGVVGCSLGGAAALLATPPEIDALVLESVYPTISEAVHNRVSIRLGPLHYVLAPALLVQLNPRLGVSPSQLRPIDHVAEIGCPVLVAAGDLDLYTTLEETERLYQAALEPKQLVVFKGAAHCDLLNYDSIQYQKDVVGFLDNYLLSTRVDEQLDE